MTETKLTDAEAEAMLRQLSEHYDMPVMPVGDFCKKVRQWVYAIQQQYREAEEAAVTEESKYGLRFTQGGQYATMLSRILIDIEKSGLMYRLLYLNEDLRTEKCPEHKGEMDTQVWVGINTCQHGCQGSGWLPNKTNDNKENSNAANAANEVLSPVRLVIVTKTRAVTADHSIGGTEESK